MWWSIVLIPLAAIAIMAIFAWSLREPPTPDQDDEDQWWRSIK